MTFAERSHRPLAEDCYKRQWLGRRSFCLASGRDFREGPAQDAAEEVEYAEKNPKPYFQERKGDQGQRSQHGQVSSRNQKTCGVRKNPAQAGDGTSWQRATVQELRDQLAKVKDDKMEIVEDETTADLEDILEENDQEKIKLKAQLDAAEQANKAMKSQLAQIQGQMTEFMIHYNTKAMDTVVPVGTPPGLAFTPEQSVKKPANLLETGLAPGTNTGLHRDAKQPFGVARRERPPHGPYTPSPHQEGEEIKNQLHKLEGMDL